MVVKVDISPRTEARLREQAEAAGKDVTSHISQLLDQAAAKASLDEILSPLRQQFAATRITDEELVKDITDSQIDHRLEQHRKKNSE